MKYKWINTKCRLDLISEKELELVKKDTGIDMSPWRGFCTANPGAVRKIISFSRFRYLSQMNKSRAEKNDTPQQPIALITKNGRNRYDVMFVKEINYHYNKGHLILEIEEIKKHFFDYIESYEGVIHPNGNHTLKEVITSRSNIPTIRKEDLFEGKYFLATGVFAFYLKNMAKTIPSESVGESASLEDIMKKTKISLLDQRDKKCNSNLIA